MRRCHESNRGQNVVSLQISVANDEHEVRVDNENVIFLTGVKQRLAGTILHVHVLFLADILCQ